MGVGDLFGKAKKLADDNADKVEGALDKAGEAIKARTPDKVDGYVDKANQAAKGAIGKDGEGQSGVAGEAGDGTR